MRLWAFALDMRACLPDHRSRSALTAHLGRLTEGVLKPRNSVFGRSRKRICLRAQNVEANSRGSASVDPSGRRPSKNFSTPLRGRRYVDGGARILEHVVGLRLRQLGLGTGCRHSAPLTSALRRFLAHQIGFRLLDESMRLFAGICEADRSLPRVAAKVKVGSLRKKAVQSSHKRLSTSPSPAHELLISRLKSLNLW